MLVCVDIDSVKDWLEDGGPRLLWVWDMNTEGSHLAQQRRKLAIWVSSIFVSEFRLLTHIFHSLEHA